MIVAPSLITRFKHTISTSCAILMRVLTISSTLFLILLILAFEGFIISFQLYFLKFQPRKLNPWSIICCNYKIVDIDGNIQPVHRNII
jgi:hypothetical protein